MACLVWEIQPTQPHSLIIPGPDICYEPNLIPLKMPVCFLRLSDPFFRCRF